MATSPTIPDWASSDYVVTISPSVNVSQLDDSLVRFLTRVGRIHTFLFGKALQITSGNDGQHVAGSAHYKNKAVDLRCLDLLDDEQALFSAVLLYCARWFKVAVFDERYTASPHWHIQTTDSVGG